jgi:hypothetical protein
VRRAEQQKAWDWALRVTEPALALSDRGYLHVIRANLEAHGVIKAVALRDTATLYEWLMTVIPYQGVSDASAGAHAEAAGPILWSEIGFLLADRPACARLRSYWHFQGCCYRKLAWTCAEPHLLSACPLPTLPLRNGRLSQAAFSLFLFLRDVCDSDLVGWIDDRLERADAPGARDRAATMRQALLEPMRNVHGVSDKVVSMALSNLLLGADPRRERWVTSGASFIVVDTLIHNFLHRTGILRRFRAEHAYGAGCYQTGGCAELVEGLADRIDARRFNGDFPARFPRFVQHALWRFCSASHWNICNGNRVTSTSRCGNEHCPALSNCHRLALRE